MTEFFYPLDQIDTYATVRAVPSVLELVVQGGTLQHADILLLQPMRYSFPLVYQPPPPPSHTHTHTWTLQRAYVRDLLREKWHCFVRNAFYCHLIVYFAITVLATASAVHAPRNPADCDSEFDACVTLDHIIHCHVKAFFFRRLLCVDRWCLAPDVIVFLVVMGDTAISLFFLFVSIREVYSSAFHLLYNNLIESIVSAAVRLLIVICFLLRVSSAEESSQRAALSLTLCKLSYSLRFPVQQSPLA